MPRGRMGIIDDQVDPGAIGFTCRRCSQWVCGWPAERPAIRYLCSMCRAERVVAIQRAANREAEAWAAGRVKEAAL